MASIKHIGQYLCLIMTLLGLISCNSDSGKQSLDLMKYGMPIKIKAPINAEIASEDLGFMKDVTVKAGEGYSIQITSSEAIISDANDIAQKILKEVQRDMYFKKIIEENVAGFIYSKDIDGQEDYDFRHVRIAGQTEYIFQTSLVGTFSLDDVRQMYDSVK